MDEEHYGYNQRTKQYSIDRLSKGDRCILAINNSKIIGYLWVMKDQFELAPFKFITLPKKRVYSYKGYVIKKYRGKRIFWATHVYLFNMLRKEGKRFIVGAIDINNKPALKLKEIENWKIIGKLIHVRFFGLKYDYIKKNGLLYLQNS